MSDVVARASNELGRAVTAHSVRATIRYSESLTRDNHGRICAQPSKLANVLRDPPRKEEATNE